MRLTLRNIIVLTGIAICCACLWMFASAMAKAGVMP